jgi:hypothetical protein
MKYDSSREIFERISPQEAELMGLPHNQETMPLADAPEACKKLREAQEEWSEALSSTGKFPANMTSLFGFAGALAIRPELDHISSMQEVIYEAYPNPADEAERWLGGLE